MDLGPESGVDPYARIVGRGRFDVRDDGRYLYSRRGDDIYVDPCGDQQFADGLRRLVG